VRVVERLSHPRRVRLEISWKKRADSIQYVVEHETWSGPVTHVPWTKIYKGALNFTEYVVRDDLDDEYYCEHRFRVLARKSNEWESWESEWSEPVSYIGLDDKDDATGAKDKRQQRFERLVASVRAALVAMAEGTASLEALDQLSPKVEQLCRRASVEGHEESLLVAAGLNPRTSTLRDALSVISARRQAARKASALRAAKTEWRARLVGEIASCVDCESAAEATRRVERLGEQLGEHIKTHASDALDSTELKELHRVLADMLHQKAAELGAKTKRVQAEAKAAAERDARLAARLEASAGGLAPSMAPEEAEEARFEKELALAIALSKAETELAKAPTVTGRSAAAAAAAAEAAEAAEAEAAVWWVDGGGAKANRYEAEAQLMPMSAAPEAPQLSVWQPPSKLAPTPEERRLADDGERYTKAEFHFDLRE